MFYIGFNFLKGMKSGQTLKWKGYPALIENKKNGGFIFIEVNLGLEYHTRTIKITLLQTIYNQDRNCRLLISPIVTLQCRSNPTTLLVKKCTLFVNFIQVSKS